MDRVLDRPGERALGGLRPRLLPLLLERPEGRGRLPGLLVDRAGRLGAPEPRLAGAVGGRPRRRVEAEAADVQPGGLCGPAQGDRVRSTPIGSEAWHGGATKPAAEGDPPVASVEELDQAGGGRRDGGRSSSSTPTSSTSTAVPTSTTSGSGSTSARASDPEDGGGRRASTGTGNCGSAGRSRSSPGSAPSCGGTDVTQWPNGKQGSRVLTRGTRGRSTSCSPPAGSSGG